MQNLSLGRSKDLSLVASIREYGGPKKSKRFIQDFLSSWKNMDTTIWLVVFGMLNLFSDFGCVGKGKNSLLFGYKLHI
jgi:hypothetical protein